MGRVVEEILADHPDELKVTTGKMVYEVQPKIDWDKGKAVLYLLEALGFDSDDVAPMYLGDDITDEHAFEALSKASPRVSASSSAAPTTRRWPDGRPPPTTSSTTFRRWNGS